MTSHFTGAPLVIEFDRLFLRPAESERGEGDVVIDNNDLTLIPDLTCMGFNRSIKGYRGVRPRRQALPTALKSNLAR
jgi:hypothetical protein